MANPQQDVCTPRVNYTMLNSHMNRTVRFVGKVANSTPQTVSLLTPDGASVFVQNIDPNSFKPNHFVEVIGLVTSQGGNLILKPANAQNVIDFGENFNFENYNELLIFMQQYKHIFGA